MTLIEIYSWFSTSFTLSSVVVHLYGSGIDWLRGNSSVLFSVSVATPGKTEKRRLLALRRGSC